MMINSLLTKRFLFICVIVTFTACAELPGGEPDKNESASVQGVNTTFTSDIELGTLAPLPGTRLLESIAITPAQDESSFTHYNVYWGDIAKNKYGLSLAPLLAQFEVKGDGQIIEYDFPSALRVPLGTQYVLVCTENNGQEYCAKDSNLELITDDLLATSAASTRVIDKVDENSEASCPGLDVMQTCGDLICDGGRENAISCPSDCKGYAVASFNFQSFCSDVQRQYHPNSIAELQSIIAEANRDNLRVKVTAAAANKGTTGSANGIVCTDGVLIVTDRLKQDNQNFSITLEQFEGVEVVNAPAGMTMHDIGEWLFERGKQMGWVHLGWRDATIAGAIGTSAHGSSPKNTNIVSNKVVAMDIINPQGELKTYSRGTTGVSNPNLWKAMLTHLGYFGIITSVRVEVEPAVNVHVKVTYHNEDELFTNKNKLVYEDIKDCDYGQYNWFPSIDRYVRWCGKQTDQAAEEGET